VYVNLTISGTTSGQNATQRNAFAADISIAGTQASWIGGAYYYISGSGTLTATTVYGVSVDMQELGVCDYRCNLWLQNSASTAATGVGAYILFSGQGTYGGIVDAMFYVQGIGFPLYFLQTADSAAKGMLDTTARDSANSLSNLVCKIGATTMYIPMIAAT
jgi:hypothetical protein